MKSVPSALAVTIVLLTFGCAKEPDYKAHPSGGTTGTGSGGGASGSGGSVSGGGGRGGNAGNAGNAGSTAAPGLAATPPMGWNSRNRFQDTISDAVVREIADAMVASGMAAAGHKYVIIDDGWAASRDDAGGIVPEPTRFPDMKALADYVHGKGLKLGLYSDLGTLTCGGRPGSFGYETRDAKSFAAWGVDYLKYDDCNASLPSSGVE